ncbi:LysE family translocator [Paucibacter sediminis]|uniref:LysE family translocator n=1 Tax=Paucibacter sediminis TaxID=3019553 RepID=A0AA95NHY3_9BURK|nr:LysE family translocator [Paucibacter sp. S2-9]WIT13472.1 LysE family translocator [Paucibacter sp. S2-9]
MMDLPTLLAVAAFATVTSITPGPNNMMLLASGVNHGFKASTPHMLGISIGFMVLLAATGLGLGALLLQWPRVGLAMKAVGIAYLVWLAWRLWRAEAPRAGVDAEASAVAAGPRMGFWAAAGFQWVNPKAWMMAIGAVAGFLAPGEGALAACLLALVCALVNFPCIAVWTYAGARLSRQLAEPAKRRAFNTTMAVLLLASIWPMLKA